MEPLEGRTLLSAQVILSGAIPDAGDTAATAINLRSIVGLSTIRASIGGTDSADRYRFSVASKGNVNVLLNGLVADADLQLLNANGQVIRQSTRDGRTAEKLSLSLDKGTYYLRVVQATKASATSYVLKIQADLNWGTVSQGSSRRTVGLVNADGSTRGIRPNRETWVVIHGWNGSPSSLDRLSDAIDGHSRTDQVLVLDWSDAARTPSVINAALWIPSVAEFAVETLGRWGIRPEQINIAAHSLGGYMANAIASDVSGGVDRMILMDPATGLLSVVFPGINYAAHSRSSTAFLASSLSTPQAALTADQTFRTNVGDYNSVFSHSNVVDLVASMIEENNTANPDPVSRLFDLDRMDPAVAQPWRTNGYTGGYEGILTGQRSNGHWFPQSLTYVGRLTGREVTVNA